MEAPTHQSPPLLGEGLLHSRILVLVPPPQVLLQAIYAPQLLHRPFIASMVVNAGVVVIVVVVVGAGASGVVLVIVVVVGVVVDVVPVSSKQMLLRSELEIFLGNSKIFPVGCVLNQIDPPSNI